MHPDACTLCCCSQEQPSHPTYLTCSARCAVLLVTKMPKWHSMLCNVHRYSLFPECMFWLHHVCPCTMSLPACLAAETIAAFTRVHQAAGGAACLHALFWWYEVELAAVCAALAASDLGLQAGDRGLHTCGALAASHGGYSGSASSFFDHKGQCSSCPLCNAICCRYAVSCTSSVSHSHSCCTPERHWPKHALHCYIMLCA